VLRYALQPSGVCLRRRGTVRAPQITQDPLSILDEDTRSLAGGAAGEVGRETTRAALIAAAHRGRADAAPLAPLASLAPLVGEMVGDGERCSRGGGESWSQPAPSW